MHKPPSIYVSVGIIFILIIFGLIAATNGFYNVGWGIFLGTCILIIGFWMRRYRFIFWGLHILPWLVCYGIWHSSSPDTIDNLPATAPVVMLYALGISIILAIFQTPIEAFLKRRLAKSTPKVDSQSNIQHTHNNNYGQYQKVQQMEVKYPHV